MVQAATDEAVSVLDYVIGENVATLQRRAGMTNRQLGEHFGVVGSAMSLKLHGRRAWSALDVQRAAKLFGVRMAQLTGEEPMPGPTAPATITDISELARKRQKSTEPTSPTVNTRRFATIGTGAPVIPLFGRKTITSVSPVAQLRPL